MALKASWDSVRGTQFKVAIEQIKVAHPDNVLAVCSLNLDEVQATSVPRVIITEEFPIKYGMWGQG